MEVAAAKALGAGIAVIALFGVGLGIGNIFSSLISSVGWRLNSLNSNIMPTEGNRFGVGAEAASPPGSIAYYKLSYQQQHFMPLNQKKTLLLMGNANLGFGQGI